MRIVYELLKEEVEKFVKGEKTYLEEGTLKLQIEFFKTANSITQIERDELISMFPVVETIVEPIVE